MVACQIAVSLRICRQSVAPSTSKCEKGTKGKREQAKLQLSLVPIDRRRDCSICIISRTNDRDGDSCRINSPYLSLLCVWLLLGRGLDKVLLDYHGAEQPHYIEERRLGKVRLTSMYVPTYAQGTYYYPAPAINLGLSYLPISRHQYWAHRVYQLCYHDGFITQVIIWLCGAATTRYWLVMELKYSILSARRCVYY